MKKVIITITILVVLSAGWQPALATLLPVEWNWNSGTTEGWIGGIDGTVVTVEAGRNGTFGLGAQGYTPTVKLEGISIDPGLLVGGQFGENLSMTGEIYVDVDREMCGDYLDLWIWGENTCGRFYTYPADGMGSIEDLGDGWYRHHLVNLRHYERIPDGPWEDPANLIYMTWNWSDNAEDSPVIYDNLTIIPEPATLVLFGLGCLFLKKRS